MDVNFVPCVAWVRQAVAKSTPDTIAISNEDMRRVIEEAKRNVLQSNG